MSAISANSKNAKRNKIKRQRASGLLSLLLFAFSLFVTSTHFHTLNLDEKTRPYFIPSEGLITNGACALIHQMQNNPFLKVKVEKQKSAFFYLTQTLRTEKSLIGKFFFFVSSRAPPLS